VCQRVCRRTAGRQFGLATHDFEFWRHLPHPTERRSKRLPSQYK
jgi:hypothetical protein